MASKRNLYRPAQVQENVGQRKPRKTLAQGRLISSNSGTQKAQSSTVSQSQLSNTSGNVSRLHTSLIQGQLEESIFSPRRLVPQASDPKCPRHGPPADSLDLSDGEEFMELPDERKRFQMPSEVLFVDASRQTVEADVSEIDIRMFVDKTPVKIICHSPARNNHSFRSQGEERFVQDKSTSQYSPQVLKARAVIREKLSGDPSEPTTAVQSIPMSPSLGSRRILQTLPSNLPQPNFDDTCDSDMTDPCVGAKVGVESDDNLSVISDIVSEDREMSGIKEVKVTNHRKEQPRPTSGTRPAKSKVSAPTRKVAPDSVKKNPPQRPDTDKKKKGRVIPSRYMQGAESKAKMSLSTRMDKSTLDKSKSNRSKDLTNSHRKPLRKTARSAETCKESLRLDVDRPHTPENQSIASSTGGKTSTPTMDGSLFSHEMDIDASAILPEVSLLAGDISRTSKPHMGSGKTMSRVTRDLRDVSIRPKQKIDGKALQQKAELHWMNHIQMAFLEAKAKKTLEDREQQVMAQIYGIYEEVERLRKVKAEKKQQLAKQRHTNYTDHLTEVQRQCLAPVVNTLPSLKKQHKCLAEALDTTRHQIATKDIHLPDNEDQFQARLEAQLLESERLLGEVSAVTRQDVPVVTDMANVIVTLEKAVEEMNAELKKNQELLAATETLTMHECSLRVQGIQMYDEP